MKKSLILCTIAAFAFAGCTIGERDDKQAYIDATVDVYCLTGNSSDFSAEIEQKANDIWVKHGFSVEEIPTVTQQFMNDDEVNKTIVEKSKKCIDIDVPVSEEIVIENQGEGSDVNNF